jgi:hypothetical protein
MDPISAAVIAAITAGLVQGAGDIGKQVLLDSYRKLKSLIVQRFGDKSELVNAIEGFESRPESSARKELVVEEITRSSADQDKDLLAAAHELLSKLQETSEGRRSVQQAVGTQIAQADRGSHAEVNVNTRDR